MEEMLEAVMSDTVLVLANRPDHRLERRLVRAGVQPVRTDRMQDILGKVMRENPRAIIVAEENEDFDLLELVLNIRDLDSEVPIILLGDDRNGPGYAPFSALGCQCLPHPDRNGRAMDTLQGLLTRGRQERDREPGF